MEEGRLRPVAVVTGASSGIGAAIACALAESGYDIVINFASNRVGADQVATSCERSGARTLVVPGDVGVDENCRRVAQEAVRRFDRIDVLINNAGVTRFAAADDLSGLNRADFEAIFAVNVIGAYQMTRACEAQLRLAPSASVVNISSHSAMSGLGSSTAYAASKGALNTLTVALARGLAPEVRVNAVCPGFVDTDWMRRKITDEQALRAFKRRSGEISPLKRLVSAEEVAEAVVFFATGARSITGQLLVIDAGTHLTIASPVH